MLDELLAKLPTGQDVLALERQELDEILLSCLVERCGNRRGPLPGPRYFSIEELENLYVVGVSLPYAQQRQVTDRLFESFGRLKSSGDIGAAPGQYGLMTVTMQGRERPAAVRHSTSGLLTWAGSDRVTLAIVFTDVVGSTALGIRLGDEKMNEVKSAYFERGRKFVAQYGGYEIKTIGDSVMAVFHSVGAALDFALAFKLDPGHSELLAQGTRAGIHIGPVTATENDVLGKEVDLAARVVQVVADAGILLSENAKRDLDGAAAARHSGLQWQPRDVDFKGIGAGRIWLLSEPGSVPKEKTKAGASTILPQQPRHFTDQTPEQLMGLYFGKTALRADKLIEPFKKMWIKTDGKILMLAADGEGAVSALQRGDLLRGGCTVECRFSEKWVDALSNYEAGETIKIVGKIAPWQNGSQLYLIECELS